MGRKIPGKKHRGVKDPHEQNLKRFNLIKDKINKAPSNPDDQPVPKSVMRLMNWKNKSIFKNKLVKTPIKSKLKNNKKNDIKIKSNNPVAQLKKIPGETNRSFGARINEAMKSLKMEKTFDDIKYDQADEEKEQKREDFALRKKKKRLKSGEPHLTKAQKKTQKDKEKKEKYKEEKEFERRCEIKRDHVAFGEVVHEPPSLNIKPRKAQLAETVPRPATKNLLLNKLFQNDNLTKQNSSMSFTPNIKVYPNSDKNELNLKGKRKDLPANVRRKLEECQKEVIDAYKLIKLSKSVKKN